MLLASDLVDQSKATWRFVGRNMLAAIFLVLRLSVLVVALLDVLQRTWSTYTWPATTKPEIKMIVTVQRTRHDTEPSCLRYKTDAAPC